MPESVVIVGAARTPMGSFQGDFSSLSAHDLGGAAIKAAGEIEVSTDRTVTFAGQALSQYRWARIMCPMR